MSDPTCTIATPIGFLTRKGRGADLNRICDYVIKYDVSLIVVGLPLDTRGNRGPQALKVEVFIQDLFNTVKVPIRTCDERYSTKEAERLVREAGHQPSRNKGLVDAASAAVILNSYIDKGYKL